MSGCEKCNWHGWRRKDVPVGHPDFGQVFPCPCTAAEQTRNLQKVSGLTGPELERRLDDLVTQGRPGTARMLQACRDFCAQPQGILTIWGTPGTAKTTALQAAINEIIARGIQAVYVTPFDLLGHIQDAFDQKRVPGAQSAYQRLSRFEHVTVLALDEFDKVQDTDWARRQLTNLIDKRYRFGEAGTHGTIIAMNSDPALQPAWIASRLRYGRNRVVHNDDSDIRPLLRD